MASQLAVAKVKELSVSLEGKSDEVKKDLLKKCAMTTLNSKLVSGFLQKLTCLQNAFGSFSPVAGAECCMLNFHSF